MLFAGILNSTARAKGGKSLRFPAQNRDRDGTSPANQYTKLKEQTDPDSRRSDKNTLLRPTLALQKARFFRQGALA